MDRSHRGSDGSSTVHVAGIPSDVSIEDLEKLFQTAGGPVEVTLIPRKEKNKNYAFVKYENEDLVSMAIQKLDKTDLKGNKIRVSFSKSKEIKARGDFNEAVEEVDQYFKIRLMMPIEMAHEDVMRPYTIGDEKGYIDFITELRRKFVSRNRNGDVVVDGIFEDDDKHGACSHPLLIEKASGKKAVPWIHVELHAIDEKGKIMLTTLAVRKDNLYVKGFMNKEGQWFELPGHADNDDMKLPEDYKATTLKGWDASYRGIMKLNNKDQVKNTLTSTSLGKDFAVRAVRRLSRYQNWDVDEANRFFRVKKIDENLTRLALAGLIVMICEAARMNPFLDTIAGGWNGETGLTSRLFDIMWDWGSMSAALLKWKKSGYRKWPIKCKHSVGYALASIHLVLDSTDVTGSGPTWVEICAVSANRPVTSVTVIDEAKCKHIIYNKQETEQVQEGQRQQEQEQEMEQVLEEEKRQQEQETELVQEEQTQQGMVPLELSVKGRRISGYQSFGMEVVIPSSDAGSGDSITNNFKWDCRKQDADVTELVARTINLDPRRKIDVTYLVMHNVVEAKVEVKLRLKDDPEKPPENLPNQHGRVTRRTKKIRGKKEPEGTEEVAKMVGSKKYTARGKITVQIDGFEDHQIVLFRSAAEEEFPLETSILMRSFVSVPFGKRLHIDMAALDIKEAPGDRLVKKPSRLSYDFGRWTPTTSLGGDQVDDNIEVEVKVAWPAQEKTIEMKPDVVFTIGDRDKSFTTFIEELRRVLARHPHPEDALDGYTGEALRDIGNHPVLARAYRHRKQPRQWIHVKLQVVVAGEETSSTTLALRDDNCCGAGFMNQSGVWYDLGEDHSWWRPSGDNQLPPEYNSVLLDWGNLWSDAQYELNSRRLGKDFARAAVRTLSRYPDVEEREKPMLALAGLFIMVCDSARFNPIFQSIVTGWDTGMEFTQQLYDYSTKRWHDISRVLLRWKDYGYNSNGWSLELLLQAQMKIYCPEDALRVVYLVFNDIDHRTKQIDMEYIIEDKEGYTTFIKELRAELAHHDHPERVLDGHPNPESVSAFKNRALLARQRGSYTWPARWIHVKLQLAEEETSTTLAVRDDNAHVIGFMNQKGVWHDLGYRLQSIVFGGKEELPPEYNSETLNWGCYRYMLGIRDMLASCVWGKEVSVWDEVREKMGTEGLAGKDFAMKAVRTLSRYPDVEEGECPKRALVGLIIMVCESARLNPVYKKIEDGWDDISTGFSKQLMEYIQSLDLISETLLRWKRHGYKDDGWLDEGATLLAMGINGPEDALNVVHLVPNPRMLQWD